MAAEVIQAVKGMNDVLPTHSSGWSYLERIFSECLSDYGIVRFGLQSLKAPNCLNALS